MKRQEPGVKMQKKERRNVVNGGAFGSTRRAVPMRLFWKSNGGRVR